MRDHQDDLVYQAFRHNLADDVARLVESVGYAFERLQAQLYDAPWSRLPKAKDQACRSGKYTAV